MMFDSIEHVTVLMRGLLAIVGTMIVRAAAWQDNTAATADVM